MLPSMLPTEGVILKCNLTIHGQNLSLACVLNSLFSVSVLSELRHHRHWQKALENITGCHFTMLPSMLPTEGMILGGNLTLHGQNLSLACFHGINFRSKAWAIFTLNDVYISFSTEAQKTQDRGINQNFSFLFISFKQE